MYRTEGQRSCSGLQPLRRIAGLPPRPPQHTARALNSTANPTPGRATIDINININISLNQSRGFLKCEQPRSAQSKEGLHMGRTLEQKPFLHKIVPRVQCSPNAVIGRQYHSSECGRQHVPTQLGLLNRRGKPTWHASPTDREKVLTSPTLDSAALVSNPVSCSSQTVIVANTAREVVNSPELFEVVAKEAESPSEAQTTRPVKLGYLQEYIPNLRLFKEELIHCVICKGQFSVADKTQHANHHRKQGCSLKSGKTTNITGSVSAVAASGSQQNDWREQVDSPIPDTGRLSFESRKKQVRDMFEEQSQPRTSYLEPDLPFGKVNIRQIDSVAIESANYAERMISYRIPSTTRLQAHPPSFLGPYFGQADRESGELLGGPSQLREKEPFQMARMPSEISEESDNAIDSQRQSSNSRQALAASLQQLILPP